MARSITKEEIDQRLTWGRLNTLKDFLAKKFRPIQELTAKVLSESKQEEIALKNRVEKAFNGHETIVHIKQQILCDLSEKFRIQQLKYIRLLNILKTREESVDKFCNQVQRHLRSENTATDLSSFNAEISQYEEEVEKLAKDHDFIYTTRISIDMVLPGPWEATKEYQDKNGIRDTIYTFGKFIIREGREELLRTSISNDSSGSRDNSPADDYNMPSARQGFNSENQQSNDLNSTGGTSIQNNSYTFSTTTSRDDHLERRRIIVSSNDFSTVDIMKTAAKTQIHESSRCNIQSTQQQIDTNDSYSTETNTGTNAYVNTSKPIFNLHLPVQESVHERIDEEGITTLRDGHVGATNRLASSAADADFHKQTSKHRGMCSMAALPSVQEHTNIHYNKQDGLSDTLVKPLESQNTFKIVRQKTGKNSLKPIRATSPRHREVNSFQNPPESKSCPEPLPPIVSGSHSSHVQQNHQHDQCSASGELDYGHSISSNVTFKRITEVESKSGTDHRRQRADNSRPPFQYPHVYHDEGFLQQNANVIRAAAEFGTADNLRSPKSACFIRESFIAVADEVQSTLKVFDTNDDYRLVSRSRLKSTSDDEATVTNFWDICRLKKQQNLIAGSDSANNVVKIYREEDDNEYKEVRNLRLGMQPRGIASDRDGNLYVCDKRKRCVHMFPPPYSGEQIEIPFTENSACNGYIAVSDVDKRIALTDPEKSYVSVIDRNQTTNLGLDKVLKGVFGKPEGLAFSGDRLIVSDSTKHQLMVFNRQLKLIQTVGSFGTQLGKFQRPKGLATKDKLLYVCDTGNNRMQVLDVKSLQSVPTHNVKFSGQQLQV